MANGFSGIVHRLTLILHPLPTGDTLQPSSGPLQSATTPLPAAWRFWISPARSKMLWAKWERTWRPFTAPWRSSAHLKDQEEIRTTSKSDDVYEIYYPEHNVDKFVRFHVAINCVYKRNKCLFSWRNVRVLHSRDTEKIENELKRDVQCLPAERVNHYNTRLVGPFSSF